jgi:hypothetical protein
MLGLDKAVPTSGILGRWAGQYLGKSLADEWVFGDQMLAAETG